MKHCAAAVTWRRNGRDDYRIDERKGSEKTRHQRSSNEVNDRTPEAQTEYAPNTNPNICLSMNWK